MRLTRSIPVVLALGMLAAPAFAETAQDRSPPAAAAKRGKAGKGAKREARMINALKKAGISQAKAQRVVAVVKQTRTEMRTLMKETRPHRKALKQNPDDKAARAAVDAAKKKAQAIKSRRDAQIAKILTPEERAKVQKLLSHGKERRGKAGKKAS